MPDLPDLAALRLLADVARLGSIGAAGRANGITQQSASERLRSLEAETRLTLLQRGARGTALTDDGVLLVGWATRLLDAAREVESSLATLRADHAHQLRVASSMTTAEHLLPGWLVRLREQHDTTVSLTAMNSAAVRAAVADSSVDLGFVEDDAPPGRLASLVVARDVVALFARPGDPWARLGGPLPLADLAARPLTWREPGSGTRRVIEEALAALGHLPVRPAVELTTTSAIRSAIAAGSPPAFLSRLTVEADLQAGSLVEVAVAGLAVARDLRALWVGSGRPPAGPVRDLLGIATT